MSDTPTNLPLAGPALNRAVAEALGYTMYHYDKDVAENCYWMLMDPQFNPVVVDVHAWGRKTEAEAWADAPDFSGESLPAREELLAFVVHQGLNAPFLGALRRQRYITPTTMPTGWALITAANVDYCNALLTILDPCSHG